MKSLLLLLASLALTSAKPASEDVSLVAEPVPDLSSGDAPAYWSAECGGRTYVGSYTLMMDWAQCRDYCTYFPHSVELGHTFSFADILALLDWRLQRRGWSVQMGLWSRV